MTVNDFIDDLTQLGEELSNPQEILTEIGSDITESMRRNVPVKTGALKQSIGYKIVDNTIEFAMLEYGFFQNYGVLPNYDLRSYHKPFNNEFGTITQPTVSPFQIGLGFRSREFGLPARKFFDYDNIINTITAGIANFTEDF